MRSVYLAGQYARRNELRIYQHSFLGRNIHVTSRWLMENAPLQHHLNDFSADWLVKTALIDKEDIERADTMIFFAEDSENQPRRGGRHVEFGMALALGKKIVVVGGKENIFHHMPGITHYETFEELLEGLNAEDNAR